MRDRRFETGRSGLIFTIILYIAAVTVWSVIVPPLEAPDETGHYDYVRHVANTGRPLNPRTPDYDLIESFQPPLFYLIAGGLISPWAPIPRPVIQFNPFSAWVSPRGGETNLFLPATHRLAQPYIHIARVVSVLCGLGTVICTFLVIHRVFQSTLAATTAAMSLTLIPQFGYMSAVLSNDNLVACLAAVTFVGLIRIVRSNEPLVIAPLLTGVTAGVGFLAKNNGLLLLPIACVACILAGSSWKARWRMVALIAVGWLLATGWWIVVNLTEGVNPLRGKLDQVHHQVMRIQPWRSTFWVTDFPRSLFHTFWGCFGWMTLPLPRWLYMLYAALCGSLLFGIGNYVGRMSRNSFNSVPREFVLAVVALSVGFAGLVLYNRYYLGHQARLLYPFLVPLVVVANGQRARASKTTHCIKWNQRDDLFTDFHDGWLARWDRHGNRRILEVGSNYNVRVLNHSSSSTARTRRLRMT